MLVPVLMWCTGRGVAVCPFHGLCDPKLRLVAAHVHQMAQLASFLESKVPKYPMSCRINILAPHDGRALLLPHWMNLRQVCKHFWDGKQCLVLYYVNVSTVTSSVTLRQGPHISEGLAIPHAVESELGCREHHTRCAGGEGAREGLEI